MKNKERKRSIKKSRRCHNYCSHTSPVEISGARGPPALIYCWHSTCFYRQNGWWPMTFFPHGHSEALLMLMGTNHTSIRTVMWWPRTQVHRSPGGRWSPWCFPGRHWGRPRRKQILGSWRHGEDPRQTVWIKNTTQINVQSEGPVCFYSSIVLLWYLLQYGS